MNIQPIEIPEQREVEGQPFPLVLSPTNPTSNKQEMLQWLTDNGDSLRAKMIDTGAILLRGFPIESPHDFDAVVRAAGFKGMPYVGGAAPRNEVVKGRVLTTNESPPSEPIPFHHEMSQVPNPPAYVMFYCDHPPASGGETPIVLSNRVYKRFRGISEDFANRLEASGVRYVWVMPGQDDDTSPIGRSWRSTFLVDQPQDAEEKMRELGMEWKWLDNDELYTITKALPAIRTDPRSGRKTFFNSVVAAYTGWVDSRNDPTQSVRCGDDSPIEGNVLLETAEAMTEECVAFQWKKGDVLLIDNALVMHSRRPFEGPRRILASIAQS